MRGGRVGISRMKHQRQAHGLEGGAGDFRAQVRCRLRHLLARIHARTRRPLARTPRRRSSTRLSPPPPSGRCQRSRRNFARVERFHRRRDAVVQVLQVASAPRLYPLRESGAVAVGSAMLASCAGALGFCAFWLWRLAFARRCGAGARFSRRRPSSTLAASFACRPGPRPSAARPQAASAVRAAPWAPVLGLRLGALLAAPFAERAHRRRRQHGLALRQRQALRIPVLGNLALRVLSVM